jgi:hypothetical protein
MGLIFRSPADDGAGDIGLVSMVQVEGRHCILVIAIIAAVITPPGAFYVARPGPMLLPSRWASTWRGASKRREARLAAAQDAKP